MLAAPLADPAELPLASDYFEVGGMTVPVIDSALARALRSITPDRRLVVLLSYLLDETDAEIARDLDLPKATVQDRRQKAIKRLKELLENNPCPTQICYSIVLNVVKISANKYPQNEVCYPEKRCINSKSALQ